MQKTDWRLPERKGVGGWVKRQRGVGQEVQSSSHGDVMCDIVTIINNIALHII